MADPPNQPPAGWYQDPSGAPGLRYWDGNAWTTQQAESSPVETTDGPSRPWYRRWWAIALGVLLAVVVLGAIFGNDGDDTTATAEPTSEPAADDPAEEPTPEPEPEAESEPEPEVPGIGNTVRDGQFEFIVTEVEPPVETIGGDFLEEEAQGQFIIVRVTVVNVGDQARTLAAASQYLFDADGRRFETSSATYALEDANKVFLENINPGNTITDAPLLYDVPEGFVPASIELHDSPFSGGVTVALG